MGSTAIQALSQIWQIEADEKRHPLPLVEGRARQVLWEESLDEAVSLLEEEQLWNAWHALSEVLGRSWRGSMLAECVNSLLRPVLDGRKHTDQGCLELFRFLHNMRPFENAVNELIIVLLSWWGWMCQNAHGRRHSAVSRHDTRASPIARYRSRFPFSAVPSSLFSGGPKSVNLTFQGSEPCQYLGKSSGLAEISVARRASNH